jgi:hypothetical protein
MEATGQCIDFDSPTPIVVKRREGVSLEARPHISLSTCTIVEKEINVSKL